MFPEINLKNPPLDSSLFFSTKCYNFYDLKKRSKSGVLKKFNDDCSSSHLLIKKRPRIKSNFRTLNPTKNNNPRIRKENYIEPKDRTFAINRVHFFSKIFFQQISNDNKEQNMKGMKLNKTEEFNNYTSTGLNSPEKWGNNKGRMKKINTFGRNKRISDNKTFDYSKDELQRLVANDIKLYIPNYKSYMNFHTKAVIGRLLLESDSGAKYREPIA